LDEEGNQLDEKFNNVDKMLTRDSEKSIKNKTEILEMKSLINQIIHSIESITN
jgi:hypothetical protein